MLKQNPAPSRNCLNTISCAVVLLGLLLASHTSAPAQGGDSYEATRERASRLLDEGKFTDALPIFEKLSKERPTDAVVMFGLGFTMLAKANTDKDAEARKQGRIQARVALARAKELGFNHPLLDSMLETLRPDGETLETFSKVKEADEAMREGEAAYVQGDLDKALAQYQRALQLDPQLYEAALFAGDMHNKKNQPEQAGEWFARAIKIDPERETAYRYWGVGLLKQGKKQEARDKFIEAFITEPFSRLPVNALVEWANGNGVKLAHPSIEIPTNVSSSEDGKVNIAVSPTVSADKGDGSAAWMMYGLTRSTWMNNKNGLSERFAKAYPAEKTYRHSLAEEMDALRMVIESVSTQTKEKQIKQLQPSLATLVKLNDAGLLEAYILLARPDEGIARDYATYRKTNRDKLRRYVVEYLMTGN
ncbi:MAG TPA: tetratricopeptide repeat protein [Pyrinomonadaceae bacterium]|jgi:tetratricopeptide (TPR) repeat protein|nr:tetratricopeptide repeat protein [Pyrinomonadaceae bacterium]